MKRAIALGIAIATLSVSAYAALPAGNVLKAYIARRTGDFSASAEYLRAALKSDPQSIEIRVRLARLLMVFSEPDQALSILDEGVKLSPDNADLHFERAKTLMMTGRSVDASDSALKASELGGGDKANIMAVRLLASAGRREKALEVADKWVAASPKSPDAYYERALINSSLGFDEKTEGDLRKVLEYKPDHQQTIEMLAGILFTRNDRAEAKKLYEQLVKINPHQVKSRLTLAQMLLEENRIEEAKTSLTEIEKWIETEPSERARLGLLWLQAESPDKALSAFDAIPEGKRDDRAWLFFGLAYLELGKFDLAVKALEKIPETSMIYEDAVERRAAALKAAGKTDEAIGVLKAFAEKYPDNPRGAINLATLYQIVERHAESAKVLEDYLQKHPESKETSILFTLGVAKDKSGDWQKSIEYMERILKINPDDAHALNYIGYTWADHGIKLDEAEAYVAKAVKLLPKNGYILDSLGWVYYQQGKYDKAVMELEKASMLAPEDPIILEHLGDARVKNGDREGAKKAYEKSLAIDPKSKTVPGKLEALR